jgi:hypothetical protein
VERGTSDRACLSGRCTAADIRALLDDPCTNKRRTAHEELLLRNEHLEFNMAASLPPATYHMLH